MKFRLGFLALALLLWASFPAQATKVNRADLEATHILRGQVENVESFYGVNDRGDQIILSHVRVKALKWIKGDRTGFVEFTVEGGSVGDMALRVSDIPEFEKGQRLRLLLKKENGEFKYEESEIEESTRFKPAKAAAGCCKTFAAWASGGVTYKVNAAGADVDPMSDIAAAAGAWNATRNVLSYGGRSTKTAVDPNDNENVVFFRDASSGGAIAVTYLWYNKRTRAMVAFDMYFFEAAWEFSSLTGKGGCAQFYYQTIATHEFGHAVGIDHNRCPDSMMYPYAGFCETNTLTEADKACLRALY